MLDRERFHEWQKRADGRDITEILDVEKDIRPLAEQCMEFGAKVLLIKCGVPGMYLRTADKNSLEKTGSKAELSADVWSEKEMLVNMNDVQLPAKKAATALDFLMRSMWRWQEPSLKQQKN